MFELVHPLLSMGIIMLLYYRQVPKFAYVSTRMFPFLTNFAPCVDTINGTVRLCAWVCTLLIGTKLPACTQQDFEAKTTDKRQYLSNIIARYTECRPID